MNPWLRSARTAASSKRVSVCITSVFIGAPSWSRWTLKVRSRCTENPPAPASIASFSSRRICWCSASVGSSPALARSAPSTQLSSGLSGTKARTLTDFGVRSTLARNSG